MSDEVLGGISNIHWQSAGVHFRTYPVTGSTSTAADELA
jgi:hypothetical protein